MCICICIPKYAFRGWGLRYVPIDTPGSASRSCLRAQGVGWGFGRGGGAHAVARLRPNRKDAGLCCGSRLRKGEVFAYVGLPQNLKDLKDTPGSARRSCSRAQDLEFGGLRGGGVCARWIQREKHTQVLL